MTPSQKVAAQLSECVQRMEQCAFHLRHLNNVSARGYSAELDRAAAAVREWIAHLNKVTKCPPA